MNIDDTKEKIDHESKLCVEYVRDINRITSMLDSVKENFKSTLSSLAENNDATLKYHGTSAEIRKMVDRERYKPLYKDLPLEERLDSIESDIAKIFEEIKEINVFVAACVANAETKSSNKRMVDPRLYEE